MPVFLDRQKAHLESGLYFDPPHDRCFRLAQCEHGKRFFQELGLQEMDFAWWDEPDRAMHLLEVKDYSEPGRRFEPDHYTNECVQKATDCLLLLASIWYGLPYGSQAKDCVPEEWHTLPAAPPQLRMFFVAKVPEPADQRPTKDPFGWDGLETRARNRMRARIELFRVTPATTLFLMDHRTAARRGLPIKSEQDLLGPPDSDRPQRRGKRR
ncbi:MAG: hypothetical protein QM820_08380 [Minicystis sp.]